MVLEKPLGSPLACKEIKPVNPKGNQPWIFIGRTNAEPEAPILGPPDAKSWLIGKDPDAGKDWRQKKKGAAEDKMADSMDMNWSSLWEVVEDRGVWGAAVHGITKSQTRLSNWTTTETTIQHRELHPVSYDKPEWKRIWKNVSYV